MLIGPGSAKYFKLFILYFYYALLILAVAIMPRQIGTWYYIPLALFLAFYLADFISGIMHFVLDYKKTQGNIGLGELFHYQGPRGSADYIARKKQAFAQMRIFERIVFNFKLHHPYPSKIGTQSYAHLCSVTIIFAAIPILLLNFLLQQYFHSFSLALFLTTLSFWAANTQYIHSLPHRKNNPRIIRLLMRHGILISKKKHAIHHATLDRDFCTINGYANNLVNALTRFLVKNNYFSKDGLEPHG